MVSFRFHLVSLVAVFLALALGIGMGVTVIDRVGVDRLQSRLDQVRAEVGAANQRSDRLQREQERADAYESSSAEYVVDGRLTDIPVTVVAVRGVDGGTVDRLEETIAAAGGRLQGTLWLTSDAALPDAGTVEDLREVLGGSPGDSSAVRSLLVNAVGAALTGAAEPSSLTPVVATGVLEWEGANGNNSVEQASLAAGLLVVVSSADARVSNDVLAVPLVKLLAAQPEKRLLAAEPGRPATDSEDEERNAFTGPIRTEGSLDAELSTVDHLDRVSGNVASVLALAQMPDRTGDYGLGDGASGVLPELNP